jgi:hypothetical protein
MPPPPEPTLSAIRTVESSFDDLDALFDDHTLRMAAPATSGPDKCLPKYPTPTTMRSLTGHPQEQDWRESLKAELDSLVENDTYAIVPRPPGVNFLRYKVVFKAKLDSFGNVQRFKSRVVSQGCCQRPGDYDG